MAEKLRVVDLLTGIGGRTLGFQRAGYDVVCAVDNSIICKEIYSQMIRTNQFVLSDIEHIMLDDLPYTDVITAKLIMGTYKSAMNGMTQNKAIFNIIFEKMPKAFLLEIPTKMITSKKSAELKYILESRVFRRYTITYQIVNEAEFSGFPVIGNQAYMIGIRNDLYNDEFYFPQGEQYIWPIFQEEAQLVDEWYRKISFNIDTALQEGKYYVRKGGKLCETDLIHMGLYKEMYLLDSRGLRRLTHNECASLKGLKGYDFNKSSNKRDMYMRIGNASNVFVVGALAKSLREYLEVNNFDIVNNGKQEKKVEKEKSINNITNDIVSPRQKLINIHIDNLKGIKNLDISFDKRVTAIMGVNGAGKSTILHALACIYKPYKSQEDYKFSFFFTPNPDSSWRNSKFSITYRDENLQKEYIREYRKNTDR